MFNRSKKTRPPSGYAYTDPPPLPRGSVEGNFYSLPPLPKHQQSPPPVGHIASYKFLFHTPPEIQDASIESVLVAGTFNDWRRNNHLKRSRPGIWTGSVNISVPAGTRYFLYKFCLHQKWSSTDIPTTDDNWIIDYYHPVMLHEEGKDCNYLDIQNVTFKGTRPLGQFISGDFTFKWPRELDPYPPQSVGVMLEDREGKQYKERPLQPDNQKNWTAKFKLDDYDNYPDPFTRYWYMVDGKKRYNPNERMGTDNDGADCNIVYTGDLELQGQPYIPIHDLDFLSVDGPKDMVLMTSFDGWKKKHPIMRDENGTGDLKVRVACPQGAKLLYCFLVNDRTWPYRRRPSTMHGDRSINYHICGSILNNRVLSPKDSTPPMDFGEHTFVWPSNPLEDVWVVGDFNGWTKSDSCKMSLSSDRKTYSVTLTMPTKRTRYKYMCGTDIYFINPLARHEEEKDGGGIGYWTNFLLPEDFKVIGSMQNLSSILKPPQKPAVAPDLDKNGAVSTKKEIQALPAPYQALSPRALEARGM